MCTKEELEEHFKALKNDLNTDLSKKFNATTWKATSVFLVVFLAIGGWLLKHEGGITSNRETITGILDSGAEFVARRVSSEAIKNVKTEFHYELDKKVDKSAFEEFGEKIDLLIELERKK
jgi:hypothetical protein